jgi:hypothetical protein
MKMVVPEAPWSAVASATAFSLGIHGASYAAAVQGASRIFMQGGEPEGHEVGARGWRRHRPLCLRPGRRPALSPRRPGFAGLTGGYAVKTPWQALQIPRSCFKTLRSRLKRGPWTVSR